MPAAESMEDHLNNGLPPVNRKRAVEQKNKTVVDLPAERNVRSAGKVRMAKGRQLHILEIAGNSIIGGMERYVLSLAEHLPRMGHQVTVLAPFESNFTSRLRALGCSVYVTAMDYNPPWRSIQFTTELVRSTNVDLLHAHLPRAHVLAGIVGRLANLPVLATVHGMEVNTDELSIHRTTGTYLSVVCQQAYAQARSLGISSDRLYLVPNGVDIQRFHPVKDRRAFRKQLGVPRKAPLVGFVGRLSWEKGPDQFVLLAKVVREHVPAAHFVMVGSGPMESVLREKVESAGMMECFHFAGLQDELEKIYPSLDVLVQTSRVEGMPLSLMEGMACGLPVAAMGVGGVIEVIEAGGTGILAAEGDWAGLGDAVTALLGHPQQVQKMGMAARKRVERHFNLAHTQSMLSSLFQRMVDLHAHPGSLSEDCLGWIGTGSDDSLEQSRTR